MTKITTQQEQEYLESQGLKCPICKSKNLTPGTLESSAGDPLIILEDVTCEDCSAEWTDMYRLIGIDGVV